MINGHKFGSILTSIFQIWVIFVVYVYSSEKNVQSFSPMGPLGPLLWPSKLGLNRLTLKHCGAISSVYLVRFIIILVPNYSEERSYKRHNA